VPQKLELMFGSSWFTVNQPTAESIAKSWRDPEIYEFFRTIYCCDEIFFPTVVGGCGPSISENGDGVRYIVWDGKANPRLLTDRDLNDMLRSGAFFARKFSWTGSGNLIAEVLRLRHHHAPALKARHPSSSN
jgi:hypothetical protein